MQAGKKKAMSSAVKAEASSRAKPSTGAKRKLLVADKQDAAAEGEPVEGAGKVKTSTPIVKQEKDENDAGLRRSSRLRK